VPEYLDGLGQSATFTEVFTDIYQRVDVLVSELDATRRGAYGDRTEKKDVPGTGLELGWPSVPREDREIYASIVVFSGHPTDSTGRRTPLVSRTEHRIPPQYGSRPENVAAYRQQEAFPDYAIAQEKPGDVITCTIGSVGLTGSRAPDRRLVGTTTVDPGAKIDTLREKDAERLRIVTARIVRNLSIAEFMTIGMSAEDAIRETDDSLAA
jgi:hypothetical protein